MSVTASPGARACATCDVNSGSGANSGAVLGSASASSCSSSWEFPLQACVNLDAIVHNSKVFARLAPGRMQMGIVKANAYGHGMAPVARALRYSGFTWFGVSHVDEAAALRQIFDTWDDAPHLPKPRILTWLYAFSQDLRPALEADLDLAISSLEHLQAVRRAVQLRSKANPALFVPARVHLKIDVGMNRGGARLEQLPELLAALTGAVQAGEVALESVWGHLNCADDPDGEGVVITCQEIAVFEQAKQMVARFGLHPQFTHLAATAGTLWHPAAHYDLVRLGIGLYGYSPNPKARPADTADLVEALTLTCRLTQVKRLHPGESVSYGATYTASCPQWIGLLPCGYGEGIPRQASNRAPVWVNGRRSRILGRVCMDQMMIDLGEGAEPWGQVGDEVVLFGASRTLEGSATGYPTAEDWAQDADTISYTITTNLPAHLPRIYTGKVAAELGLTESSSPPTATVSLPRGDAHEGDEYV